MDNSLKVLLETKKTVFKVWAFLFFSFQGEKGRRGIDGTDGKKVTMDNVYMRKPRSRCFS